MNQEHDQHTEQAFAFFLLLRDELQRQVDRMAKPVYGL